MTWASDWLRTRVTGCFVQVIALGGQTLTKNASAEGVKPTGTAEGTGSYAVQIPGDMALKESL
jgi:hypothetical protein